MKWFLASVAIVVAVFVAAGMGTTPEQPQTRISFQIATGSSAGTYYPIGQMLASIISHPPGVGRCQEQGRCGPMGLLAAARVSAGSVSNARAVNNSAVASALVQSDIAATAYAGQDIFKSDGPLTKLRAIGSLFPELVHIVVAKDAGIKTLADLKKKRVSIDSEGSGTHATARKVLSAAKLTDKMMTLSLDNAEVSAGRMMKGELDAFFFVGGPPLQMIVELAQRGQIELLEIDGPGIDALLKNQPNIRQAMIPADTYPGIASVKTVGVSALWVVNADLPEDLIYQITRALWNDANRPLLDSGHPMGRLIQPQSARIAVPIPFHPGAERYYAEMDAQAAPQR
jgi:TRAP transporter TAXI family solute receptor